jgi:DNA-binding SARP family transcriptional activator/DNA-binding XRE family transcriptional regulator
MSRGNVPDQSEHAAPWSALLRERRREAGLTQDELAELTGVSTGTIRDIEQGRVASPRAASVGRLVAALGMDIEATTQLGPDSSARRFTPVPAGPVPGLWVGVLGALAVRRNRVEVALRQLRVRTALGLLALHANTLLHREAITEAIWGGHPPRTAVVMVQHYISAIRRLAEPGQPSRAGPSLLISSGAGYRLQLKDEQTDHLTFRWLVADARKARSAHELDAASGLYVRALGLWRGEPLADLDALHDHPVVLGLRDLRVAAVLEYADVCESAGRYEQVLPLLQEFTRRDPLNERAHASLMTALAATGQQAAALQIYENLLRRLDDELGVRPGREIAEAHLKVLRQEIPPPTRQSIVGQSLEQAPDPAKKVSLLTAMEMPASGHAPAEEFAGEPRSELRGKHQQIPANAPRTGDLSQGRAAEVHVVPGVPRQLPGTVAHLAGRATELAALTRLLDEVGRMMPGTAVISVVGGMAGVGKTTLVLHWAHRVAPRFPDGQLYVNLRGFDPSGSPVTPAEAIRGFLVALGVRADGIPPDLVDLAGLHRSLLADKRMLIMLDNARDEQQVRPLLPASPHCLVLITSRNQLPGLAATDNARLLPLDVLTEASAEQLLIDRLGAQRAAAEPTAVTDIVRLCARLPLALTIAAANAATRPGLRLADLAAELRDAQCRLDILDTGDPATSIRAVFSWSIDQLSPAATRLFQLLGLHPGPDITAAAAASLAGVPVRLARQAISELLRAHLLTEHVPGRFAFHDLLHVYAADQARQSENAKTQIEAVDRMLGHYLHTAYEAAQLCGPFSGRITIIPTDRGVTPEHFTDSQQAHAWFEAEYRVLTGLVTAAVHMGFDDYAWRISCTLAYFLDRSGRRHDKAAIQAIALQAAERIGDKAGEAAVRLFLASPT